MKKLLDEEIMKKEMLKEKITEQQTTIKALNACLETMESKFQNIIAVQNKGS